MTSGAMGSPCMVMAYIPLDTTEKKEQECIWFKGGNLNGFQGIQQFPFPGAIFNALNILPVTLAICPVHTFDDYMKKCWNWILLYALQLTLDFTNWPCETLAHKPLSLRIFVINSINFRRYELRRTDTMATVCSPDFFFRIIKKVKWCTLKYKYLGLGNGMHNLWDTTLMVHAGTLRQTLRVCLAFLWTMFMWSFGYQVFQRSAGIAMGTNCAPLLADSFLYS
jgi:hypothetical protein